MTTLRTAAQQALSALELGYDAAKSEADQYHAAMAGYRPQRHAQMDADVQQIASAITALKAALAEPEDWELRRLHAELERCKFVCAATAESWREATEQTIAELFEQRDALLEALRWIADHDLLGTDLMVAGHMAHGFIGRARAAVSAFEGEKA